ncbi:g5980 [Coccomyxa elongata]
MEAAKKKGKCSFDSLPAEMAAGERLGEEQAESSGILGVWRGGLEPDTRRNSLASNLDDSLCLLGSSNEQMDTNGVSCAASMARSTLSTAESVEKASASTSSSSIGGSHSMSSKRPEPLDSGVPLAKPPVGPVSSAPKEGPEVIDQQNPSTGLPTADPLLAAESVMSSVPDQAARQEAAPEHAAENNGDLFQELVGLPSTSARAGPGLPAAQTSGAAAAGSAETVADVTTAPTSAPLADVAPPGNVAACGRQLSQQHAVQPTWQPPQPLHQPLAHATTGNPFARGLLRPCSPVNAFAAHTRSRSMPSFLFDDEPRPASAPPYAASPTAAAAQANAMRAWTEAAPNQALPHQGAPEEAMLQQEVPKQAAPDQAAPNQAAGLKGAWLYQVQPSPGVWLQGTRARPVDVILSEVLGMPKVGAAAAETALAGQQPVRAPDLALGQSTITASAAHPGQATASAPEAAPPQGGPSAPSDAGALPFSFSEAECTFRSPTVSDQHTGASPTQVLMPALAGAASSEGSSLRSGQAPGTEGASARSGFLTLAPESPRRVEDPIVKHAGGLSPGGPEFPLMLPKREAPPPPRLLSGVLATGGSRQWSASEDSEAGSEGPGEPTSAGDMAATWRPMRQADKDSCRRAFHMKGHAELGGVSQEDAEAVHRELRTSAPFSAVWALADWDATGRLSELQFVLFMFLLKQLKKGRQLPPRLGLNQVSHLLGIPCDQLLPAPAADKWSPQLAPLPESVSGELQALPHPAVAGHSTPVEPAAQAREPTPALTGQAGHAWVAQAQLRQPSDLILQLVAGSKAARAEGTPQGVSLKRPLQAGAGGTPGLSPPLPLGSPSFWQPFGVSRGSEHPVVNPRPASAPSPTAQRGAAAAAGGPFAPDQAAPWNGGSATWRAFEAMEALGSRHAPAGHLDTGATSDEEWQPFQDTPVNRSSAGVAAEPQRRPMDAWADDSAPPAHSQSVPVSWGADMGRPRTRVASTSSEARGQEHGGGVQQRGNAQGRPPSGQQRGHSQSADLLSTWPQRAGLREGIPSPRRASPAVPSPGSGGGITPRSLSPDTHPPSHVPAHGHIYRQPVLRPTSSTGSVRRLAITIDRANIDYRKPLDRPVFSVSLHDADGRPLEAPQDTPPGHFDRGSRAITAGHTVILRTPMRQMPPEAVVYVEVKHWKSASRKMSVLGWSFAPIETLVDVSSPPDDLAPRAGQLFLHLWRKPLDLSAHQQRTQLKALHPHDHDLFLSIASA